VILEADETDTTIAEYTLANGQLVSQNRSGTPTYYLYDAQGSVRSLTNSSGTPTDQYDYTAFGELKNYSGSSTPNNYQYTGQQYDDEIDLYSLRARYYDPANGRFLSRDTWPIDLQNPIELNRYGYTANNPVNHSDPSGYGISSLSYANILTVAGSATIGALAGGGADLAFQLVIQGRDLEDIDLTSIAVSAILGGISGGVGGTISIAEQQTFKMIAASAALDIGLGTIADIIFFDRKPGEALVFNIASFGLSSLIGNIVGKVLRTLTAPLRVKFPKTIGKIKHIFKTDTGHVNPAVTDRPYYIREWQRIASNPANFRPNAVASGLTTQHGVNAGVKAYTKVVPGQGQLWVLVRNGIIQDAGVNLPGSYR
jgi:RHS repeat-associated protein